MFSSFIGGWSRSHSTQIACGMAGRRRVIATQESDRTHFAGVDIAELVASHGMRLIVQDMGNGVYRAVGPKLLPIAVARAAVGAAGQTRIVTPEPVRDLTMSVLAAVGVLGLEKMRFALGETFARPIEDRAVEMVGWLLSL